MNRNDTIASMKLTLTRSQESIIFGWKETNTIMRYAAYVRTNCRDESGNTYLMTQQNAIEAWIAAQGGVLVALYTDEAPGGCTTDLPALRQMQCDASRVKFDAVPRCITALAFEDGG